MRGQLHGIVVIDKPAGWTSHDVVGWVRRWAGEKKVGHAGTLDPAATGVLPVALNDATRVLEFLTDASKAYLADITFGVATDSADGDGTVIAVSDRRPSLEEVADALDGFRGSIEQTPPRHSAIRIDGQRAYDLARAGVEIEMPSRTVEIHLIDVCGWDGETAQIHIECSKGTYIRSIARDLGEVVGIPSYLSNLVRTRSGPYTLDDAWTIGELEQVDAAWHWEAIALHPDSAVSDWPAIVMTVDQEADWGFGRPITISSHAHDRSARVYDSTGRWRGIARRSEDTIWSPSRVIAAT